MLYPHYEGLLRGDACDVTVRVLASSEPAGGVRPLDLTRKLELAYGSGSEAGPLCESSVDVEAYDEDGSLTDFIVNLTDENAGVVEVSWVDPGTAQACVWSGGIAPGTLYDVPLYPRIQKKAIRFAASCGLRRLGEGAAAWQAGGGTAPTMRTLLELLAPLLAAAGTDAARTVDYAPSVRPSAWRALGTSGTSAHWLLDTRFRPSSGEQQGTPARDAASGLLGALGLRVWLGLDERWHTGGTLGEGTASTDVLRVTDGTSGVVSRSSETRTPIAGAVRADASVSRAAPTGVVDVGLALGGTELQLVRDVTLATWKDGLPLLYEIDLQGDSTIQLVGGPSGNGAARLSADGFNNLPATLRSVLCRVKEGELLRLRCLLDHRAASSSTGFSWRLRIVPDDPAKASWSGKPATGWLEGNEWLRTTAYADAWNQPVGDLAGPIPASGQLVYEVMVEGGDAPVDVARLTVMVGSWREGEVLPTPPALPDINLPRSISGLVGAGKGRETKGTLPTHEFDDGWGPLITTLNGWTAGETGWLDENGVQRWTLQNLVGARLLGLKRRAEVTTDGLLVPGTRALLDVPGAGETAFVVASCRVDMARYQTKATLVTP